MFGTGGIFIFFGVPSVSACLLGGGELDLDGGDFFGVGVLFSGLKVLGKIYGCSPFAARGRGPGPSYPCAHVLSPAPGDHFSPA